MGFHVHQKRAKDSKKSAKKRVSRKELDEMIRVATRSAHIARDKGFYIVSPEARECVKIIREIRSLSLTTRLILGTHTFRTIQFLATNGNPVIRSESRSLFCHLKSILEKEKNERDFKGVDTREKMNDF